jgi:23S rRNA pseudouridine1911/1915/1917 synthase
MPEDKLTRTVVEADQDHATVAAIVRVLLELTWTKARELVRTGRVSVDGVPCFDPAARVLAGAVVEINPTGKRRRAPQLEPERLVHVDAEIVVVDKPAGLISVPLDKDNPSDSLIERTRVALLERERDKVGDDRLGVVQRLDEATTGLIVFARTRRARKHLEEQFRARTVERRLVALVYGHAEATIHDSYLVPDRGDGVRGSWRGEGKPPPIAKRSVTKVRVEQRLQGPSGELTLISCRLETGRQHQIRIHLAEAGHPLVGDRVYGRDRLGIARPLLHSASLGFRHPAHDRPLRFESPLPPDFRAVLDSL